MTLRLILYNDAMSRPPVAREKILAAARQIVKQDGAGRLTFDELVKVSGITRGGITYHFPTKEDLLRALLDSDFAQCAEAEAALTLHGYHPESARLLGFIRNYTTQDEPRRRFPCGVLAAATLDPALIDRCRQELQRRLGHKGWSDRDLHLHLLHLAAEGLMWQDLLHLSSMPAPVRARLVALMERLARKWGADQPWKTTMKTRAMGPRRAYPMLSPRK